jgi:hypothetical protein
MGRTISRFVLLALLPVSVACGPVWMLPGGRLSGETAPAPSDWTFSEAVKTVQLETRPGDPYSVNVWGAGIGDRFYLASGKGGEARWARYIDEDPEVRLRVGDTLYELRAVRVEDEAERERFLAALERKYDWQPEGNEGEDAWLFRLDPR